MRIMVAICRHILLLSEPFRFQSFRFWTKPPFEEHRSPTRHDGVGELGDVVNRSVKVKVVKWVRDMHQIGKLCENIASMICETVVFFPRVDGLEQQAWTETKTTIINRVSILVRKRACVFYSKWSQVPCWAHRLPEFVSLLKPRFQ